ncbi:hypothetical protein [Flavobacterium sp. ASW18X]|uniref:hypothetical protein n=1 Tax=Flavobacterium sp. ASW18X TaxID=2572595 RepID=UPI0010AE1845|nr:hypothetical protein [Flavobacterium sp. ASW18X]TKD63512.1 hypothetical protein FBT53_08010 [Flavobacterium sp. ASW18X]
MEERYELDIIQSLVIIMFILGLVCPLLLWIGYIAIKSKTYVQLAGCYVYAVAAMVIIRKLIREPDKRFFAAAQAKEFKAKAIFRYEPQEWRSVIEECIAQQKAKHFKAMGITLAIGFAALVLGLFLGKDNDGEFALIVGFTLVLSVAVWATGFYIYMLEPLKKVKLNPNRQWHQYQYGMVHLEQKFTLKKFAHIKTEGRKIKNAKNYLYIEDETRGTSVDGYDMNILRKFYLRLPENFNLKRYKEL